MGITANWTKANLLKTGNVILYTKQAQTLADLRGTKELTYDQCVFLLHLMICLGSGDKAQQASIKTIATADCNSIELPNSNFATSLVYLTLLLLIDPLGSFCQTHDQISKEVNRLIELIVSTDTGSQALKDALTTQAKILKASASYPMNDPYNPAIGFNTRKSDVLNAINATWSNLSSSS